MSQALVLCYHGVSESWDASEAVTPEALERQLSRLVRSGWRAATFGEVAGGERLGRTVAITFDDALASVRRLAFPIIERLGLTATVFAPTAYVGSGARCAWEGLDRWADTTHADELCPMSWEELGELADSGWEIGSHTCTHRHLTGLGDEALARELAQSRDAAVAALGAPFETIAYPYGDVDQRVVAFARRAGYRAGAALAHDLRDRGRYRWPRVGIYRRDTDRRFRLKSASGVRRLRASPLWAGVSRSRGRPA